jgi:hypothetical protein
LQQEYFQKQAKEGDVVSQTLLALEQLDLEQYAKKNK